MFPCQEVTKLKSVTDINRVALLVVAFDLTPLNFLLCKFLKERVYSYNQRSLKNVTHKREPADVGNYQQTL